MPYELLEHTADIRMRVTGMSLEEIFQSSFLGMMNMLHSLVPPQEKMVRHRIVLSATDVTLLLIDFLNAVLTQAFLNKEIYQRLAFRKLTTKELNAEIEGVPITEFQEDIKAVSFHEANIVQNARGEYTTNLVFDV